MTLAVDVRQGRHHPAPVDWIRRHALCVNTLPHCVVASARMWITTKRRDN